MGLGSEPPWITHFIRSCIGTGRSKWLWSCNHKNIRTLYLLTRAWIGVLGTGLRMLFWMKLGSVLGDDQLYKVIVPAHALVRIFYDNTNFNGGEFGNWLTPPILGAPDMAFPWLNNIRFLFLLYPFWGAGLYLFKRVWWMGSLATTVGGWKVIKKWE